MSGPEIKVVYILGWGRNGSTLLDNVLGELDGFFSTGELHALWKRGLLEGRHQCGCGAPVGTCEIWSGVLAAAFGHPSLRPLDIREIVRLQDETVRMRRFGRLLRESRDRPIAWPALSEYAEIVARLYQGIVQVTGARVVVDSSKVPSHAALLALLPQIEPYFVHLVRDPRAIAYSKGRQKTWPGVRQKEYPPRSGAARSTIGWVATNLAAEAVRLRCPAGRWLRVRYEDFVRDPRTTVQAIAALAGEAPPRLPFVDDQTVLLNGNHTVCGNPSRFSKGEVRLRADDEWMTRQGLADRLVATCLALPLLHRYGYAIRPINSPSGQRDRELGLG
jgi:hypothetical protein